MVERRKYRRFKTKLLLTTMYQDNEQRIVTEDSIFSEDIGVGGLRISFPRQLPKGKILDLKLFLFSDPIHLPAQGKVVWSNKKQGLELAVANNQDKKEENELFWVGIQFIGIDSFTRERVFRWIKKEFSVQEVEP